MKSIDYFNNTGGLNLTDSPFVVQDNQATDGANYEYLKTGAIRKRLGFSAINSVADTELRSKGLGILNPVSGSLTQLRAAGTKLQKIDTSTPLFTNLTEDTTAVNSNFFVSDSTQYVNTLPFNTTTKDMTILTGGGATIPWIYVGNSDKVTQMGVSAPTGTMTLSAGGTGGSIPTGTYYYALALRKTSTQSVSNAALDDDVSVTSGDKVTITFPAGIDTAKYDKWYIYRSAISGAEMFTTGNLVAEVDTSQSNYIDDGASDLTGIDNVPRAGGVIDYSPLESGTYNYATIYKRCVVVAKDSSVYFSDLNLPEAFPIDKYITIPSGGPITGLATLSYSTANQLPTELLVIFKKNEMWVVTGDTLLDPNLGIYDLSLQFLDSVGCANQSLIVNSGGYLSWIDYRGIYMWNGSYKPVYVSRPIEALWANDGNIDKTNLKLGFGVFYRKQNLVEWVLSHKIYGENKYAIKLDLRLTAPRVSENLENLINDAVIVQDSLQTPLYAGTTYLPINTLDEVFLTGDDAGFLYDMYSVYNDNGSGINFSYSTKWLDQDTRGIAKSYNKVVVFVDELGDWDLKLTYSTSYNPFTSAQAEIDLSVGPTENNGAGIWDISAWDVGVWDQSNNKIKALTYNLNSLNNANSGDAIKLTFSNSGADQGIVIHGFTIYYDEYAVRK